MGMGGIGISDCIGIGIGIKIGIGWLTGCGFRFCL